MDVCMYIYIYMSPQFLQEGLNSDHEIIGMKNKIKINNKNNKIKL